MKLSHYKNIFLTTNKVTFFNEYKSTMKYLYNTVQLCPYNTFGYTKDRFLDFIVELLNM